jgi:VanZ family protein
MSIKLTSKVCSVAVLFLLVFAALGPAKWIPRSGLGWQIDHFVGYFALTLTFCLVWQRPLVVGGALMALAMLLEGLQAFTPDRHADLYAAMISASGAMAAVLPADFFIQAPRRMIGRTLLRLARMRLVTASSRSVAPKSPALAGLVGQQLPSG